MVRARPARKASGYIMTATTTTHETFVYTTLPLPRFEATLPVAYAKGNRRDRYIPFRLLCALIGVERKRQLASVRERYGSALRALPLETPAGARPALWLRSGEAALWLGYLNPAKTALKTRERLEAFQADFKEAADRLLFEGPATPVAARGMFAHSARAEYVFSCLACGAGHRIIAQNGEVTLERHDI
jgi:hypothetical protein